MTRVGAMAAVLATACNQLLDSPSVRRGACSPQAGLVRIAPVGGLASDLGVQSAQLSRDERTIMFSQLTVTDQDHDPVSRLGDLYVARRAGLTDDFADAIALESLNTELDEHGASLADDELTVYFDRRDRSQRYRIFAASRPEPDAPFGAPASLALGDGTASEVEPFVTPSALYFATRQDDGAARLFTATGRGTAFEAPRELTSLEIQPFTTAYENPVVSFDGLTIYFSAPPDQNSARDIWMASRPAVDQPFGSPRPITILNTSADERPAWISEDNCRLYFITNRGGHVFSVWMASRRPP